LTGPGDGGTADAEAVIEVRDLITHYGRRPILKSVDLDVRQGEIMVIMGGSGSGKTTLLRHMLGLQPPTSGTVRVLETDIAAADAGALAELRKKIGVAFQGGALFSSMSVVDNIVLPLVEHTDLDPVTMRIMARLKLEVVGLAGFGHLKPSELSGGMIKRAALARAIVMPNLVPPVVTGAQASQSAGQNAVSIPSPRSASHRRLRTSSSLSINAGSNAA